MLILYKNSVTITISKKSTDKRTIQTGSWGLTLGQGEGTSGAGRAGSALWLPRSRHISHKTWSCRWVRPFPNAVRANGWTPLRDWPFRAKI